MQEKEFNELMGHKFDCSNKEELNASIDKFLILLDALEKTAVSMADNYSTNNPQGKAATLVYFKNVVWDHLLQQYNGCLAKAKEICESNKVIEDAQPLPENIESLGQDQMATDGPKFIKKVKTRLQKISRVLRDDSKIQSIDKDDDGCFIATATMGHIDDPVVYSLREFRDEFLLRTRVGRMSISLYYKCSPPLANIIARHSMLRKLSFIFLIQPVYKLVMLTKWKS